MASEKLLRLHIYFRCQAASVARVLAAALAPISDSVYEISSLWLALADLLRVGH